jgi:HAD superfamily hydrolase (TIGR01509 family)
MDNSLNLRNRVRVVALDFDGVITNLDIDWNSAIRLASKSAGYDVKSLLTFYEVSHGSTVFQKVSTEMEKLEMDALKNAEPTPFAKEFLEKISKGDIETYVVSMQSAPAVEKFLRQHDLIRYFKEILTRERFPTKKSQIEYVLEKSRVSPNEVLLVDDSERNVTSCRMLGIRCFHFIRRQDAARTKQMWDSTMDIVQGHIR